MHDDAGALHGSGLTDAHVHLSDPHYAGIMPQVLCSMDRLGIDACCVSTGTEDSARTLGLARTSGRISAFVGIHPERAGTDDPELIAELVRAGGVAGIGEIGLDPTLAAGSEYQRQRSVFGAMLALAEEHGLPVSVHSRKSLADVLDAMSSYRLRGALLHWFEGRKRQMDDAADRGCHVSFGPLAVYAHDKQELISHADERSLLAETDGPVRFSRCFDGAPAQPCHIPSVVSCMARARGVTYASMRATLARNAASYLRAGA